MSPPGYARPSGATPGRGPQFVTAKVFVEMIRGDGSTPPDKRLIFFSTNHVGKMALEIKELTDQARHLDTP